MEGVDSLIECKASFALKNLAVANGWLVRNFVHAAPEAQQGDGIFTTSPLDAAFHPSKLHKAPESLRSSGLKCCVLSWFHCSSPPLGAVSCIVLMQKTKHRGL